MTGKRLPVTQTEVRLVFQDPPRLGFGLSGRSRRRAGSDRDQAGSLDRPAVQARCTAGCQHASGGDHVGHDVRRGRWRGSRRRTRCCCTLRLVGQATRFTRQDGVEETWRIMQPLLDAATAVVQSYDPWLMGPSCGGRSGRTSAAAGTTHGCRRDNHRVGQLRPSCPFSGHRPRAHGRTPQQPSGTARLAW